MKLSDMTIEQAAQALKTWTQHREYDFVAPFLALPGLRGFWPMSSINSAGIAMDQSGHGRTLSYTGNPTYSYSGLVPYIALDGTGDYLARADEAGLDITGTEAFIASAVRGLTLGGWFYLNSLTPTVNALMTKVASNNMSYMLAETGGVARFYISDDGSTGAGHWVNVGGAAMTTGQWYFVVGRFAPSAELAVWVNGTQSTNTASIPASIYDGTATFTIGYDVVDSSYLQGRASLCFLCAALLSNDIVGALYQRTRPLFGV